LGEGSGESSAISTCSAATLAFERAVRVVRGCWPDQRDRDDRHWSWHPGLSQVARAFRPSQLAETEGLRDVRLYDGTIAEAEIHWYEAHGIGKRWMKIKRYLD
jgi:hypothetical protein